MADTEPPELPDARAVQLDEGRMPFLEHLRELRTRLRNAIISLGVAILVAFQFRQELYVLLVQPMLRAGAKVALTNPAVGRIEFRFADPIEPFWTFFSISFWAGVFLSSPLIFHQIWKFIAPGLYKNERRYGIAFAASSAVFFLAGAAFCYAFVLQPVFEFLLGYSSENLAHISSVGGIEYSVGSDAVSLRPELWMSTTLDLSKKMLLGFGLVFELPLVVFFLSLTGAVTHRSMWKFNRWAIILSVVLAAILTPPDIYSQIFLAGPIIVLYNLSIGIAWVVTLRRERKQRAAERDLL